MPVYIEELPLGCWILDTGYWILDTGCWMLDTGYWILDTGYWILDAGEVIAKVAASSVGAVSRPRLPLICRHNDIH
jgi:hypothetical protein